MNKPIATLVTVFLLLVSLMHILRIALNLEIIIGGVDIPSWASVLGIIVPGGLAILLKKESAGQ